MKKLLLTLIVSIAFCGSIFAQYESHWPGFYHPNFENQGALVAAIVLDGQIVTAEDANWDALEIAFFVGDECRGTDNYLYNGYVEEYGDPFPIIDGLPVFYNDPGETVTVKMYDHLNEIEYNECNVTLLGEPFTIITGDDNMQGWDDPENPIMLNFTTPGAPEPTSYVLHIDGYDGNEGGYYLIASPINEETTPSVDNGFITSEYDLYYFDQAEENEWRNYKANEFGIVAGKGYLYASLESTDLTFTGTPYDGEGTFPLEYSDENPEMITRGWNLVGNPFNEEATVDRDYYVMNEDGSDVMTEPASGTIAPMTGCFVIAEGEDENVTFSLEEPDAKGSLVAINLCNNRGVIDRAIVRFGQGRQLPKFQLNRNSTKIYIPLDNEDYAIVRSEGMGEMPVNFKANENGVYSLNVTSENVGFNYLHLIDNLTGADVDLLANPSYSFEASSTDYASRFRLVFATGNADDSFAFFSNGSFVISNDGEATVQVIDVNGRIMSSQSINGSASINVDGAAGVYMIRLINGDNVKVQKVVVK